MSALRIRWSPERQEWVVLHGIDECVARFETLLQAEEWILAEGADIYEAKP